VRWPLPTSLKVTVPAILLGFVAVLTAVNLLYHVPEAQRVAEEENRKRMAQELSRLQSSLEYFLLKGDMAAAQHEVAILAHNHEVTVAGLADDRDVVIATTRRAWLGQYLYVVLPETDLPHVADAMRAHSGGTSVDASGNELLGYTGVLMGSEPDQLRPSRMGTLFIAHDLTRYKAEARALVVRQSLYWAGWVTALAAAMWLVFHFLLTRRTARLVRAAEQLAAGDVSARSGLRGDDELGRLSRAFDAMAMRVADTQSRLRRDIDERARVQRELEASAEALRNSEASYRAIFDSAEDAIFIHDIDTASIVDVNPRACKAFGYSVEELRKLDIGALGSGVPPYTRDDAFVLFGRAVAGENLRMEWHMRSRSGELRWYEIFSKRATIGGRDRILSLARDIDERKKAAEELTRQRESLYQREKLAALGSLLAGVSHELNNPLSVVVARAVLLEERGDPATRGAAIKIRTAAERCARIVRTFLAMARQQPSERGAVRVNDVVNAALDIASYAIRTSGVEVALDLAPGLPLVLADPDQLHQVFMNLVINAQQALQDRPAPRRIRISSRFDAAAHAVRVVVADNGPGIPETLRVRIFEPFFTTKATGSGTGVGLAVSLGIVESHGGTIGVECPREGGATFTVTLPARTELESVPAGAAPRLARDNRGKILVVDDEAEIRDALAEILADSSHRVVTVSSGREALARMGEERFDAILTDVRMADLDGCELYREIEKRWPRIAARVIFVTGDTLATDSREFVARSGRPVIEKPFLPSEVRRVVAELVMESDRAA
jgi:two-component system NtrC family sensor kinase